MNQTYILAAIVLCTVCGCAHPKTTPAKSGSAPTQNRLDRDAEIVRLLPGTWAPESGNKEFLEGRTIYRKDRTGLEIIWPTGHPDRAIKIDFIWEVFGGRLIVRATSSTNPRIVPVGLKLVDHILSISDQQMVVETGEGHAEPRGSKRMRIRKNPSDPAELKLSAGWR